jgi:hypothetical protein
VCMNVRVVVYLTVMPDERQSDSKSASSGATVSRHIDIADTLPGRQSMPDKGRLVQKEAHVVFAPAAAD